MLETVLFDLDGTIYNYDIPDKIGIQAVYDYACPILGLTPGELHAEIKAANAEIVSELGKGNAAIHNQVKTEEHRISTSVLSHNNLRAFTLKK